MGLFSFCINIGLLLFTLFLVCFALFMQKAIDKDGSGTISFSEFERAIRDKANISVRILPDNILKDIFDAIDTNKNGTLKRYRCIVGVHIPRLSLLRK